MAAPIVAGGFTEEQLKHIRTMIFEGLEKVHSEAQSSVTAANNQLKTVAEQIEGAWTQQLQAMQTTAANADAQIKAITDHLQRADTANTEFMTKLKVKETQVETLLAGLSLHAENKEKILGELSTKQQEMEGFKVSMETLSSQTQQTMYDLAGGWRTNIETALSTMQSSSNLKFQEIATQIGQLGRTAQNAGGMGSQQYGGGSGQDPKSLIFEKDQKLPEFPHNPSAEQFRRWLDLFSRHCNRIERFKSADCVFEELRHQDVPVDEYREFQGM